MYKITDKQLKEFFKIGTKQENDTFIATPVLHKEIICKVWGTCEGAKLITIPRKSNINKGDYVKVLKVQVKV